VELYICFHTGVFLMRTRRTRKIF